MGEKLLVASSQAEDGDLLPYRQPSCASVLSSDVLPLVSVQVEAVLDEGVGLWVGNMVYQLSKLAAFCSDLVSLFIHLYLTV